MADEKEQSGETSGGERAASPERPAGGNLALGGGGGDRGGDRGPRMGGGDRGGDRGPRMGGGGGRGGDRDGGRGGDRGGDRDGAGADFHRGKVCQFCVEKMIYVDYKDLGRLRDYVNETGKIKPRRVSGACATHQRMVNVALKRARSMALLPFKVR